MNGNGAINGAAQNAALAVAARLSAVLMAPLLVGFIGWAALTISSDGSRITVLEHDGAMLLTAIAGRVDERDLKLRDLRMDQLDKRLDAWESRIASDERRVDVIADRLLKIEDSVRGRR